MNTNRPDPLRCAALVLLSLTCAAFLIELNSSTPWPPTDPSVFLDWWERHGTATAAITLLRIVGTTLAGWGIFIGTAGLLASIRPSGLLHGVWRRITPSSFRQILAASAITVTLAAPTVASASTQGVQARIVLEDLGALEDSRQNIEAARFTPVLTDLGPLTVEMSSEPTAETMLPYSDTTASRLADSGDASPADYGDASRLADSGDASPADYGDASRLADSGDASPADSGDASRLADSGDASPADSGDASRLADSGDASPASDSRDTSDAQHWTVTEGDHLWKIAMKTLRGQGYETEPAAVVDYWRHLIAANSEILNGNPDLIHPGTVLTLPPVQPQS